jgi:hypothetical protein
MLIPPPPTLSDALSLSIVFDPTGEMLASRFLLLPSGGFMPSDLPTQTTEFAISGGLGRSFSLVDSAPPNASPALPPSGFFRGSAHFFDTDPLTLSDLLTASDAVRLSFHHPQSDPLGDSRAFEGSGSAPPDKSDTLVHLGSVASARAGTAIGIAVAILVVVFAALAIVAVWFRQVESESSSQNALEMDGATENTDKLLERDDDSTFHNFENPVTDASTSSFETNGFSSASE